MKLTITEIFNENDGCGLRISAKGLDYFDIHGPMKEIQGQVEHLTSFIELAFDAGKKSESFEVKYIDLEEAQELQEEDSHGWEYQEEYELDCVNRVRDMNQEARSFFK